MPLSRHGRNRTVVIENWAMTAEQRRLGFKLAEIWRDLHTTPGEVVITYKAFRSHVREVAERMAAKS